MTGEACALDWCTVLQHGRLDYGRRFAGARLMRDWALSHEAALRFGLFFGVLSVMALWELVAARRELSQARPKRWFANLGMAALGAFLARLLFPAAATGMALTLEQEGWGLLNRFEIPYVLAVTLSVVALDLAIYLQHVMFHAVPTLWRLHMVHHADVDFDVTTGSRFHTIEIALSIGIKLAAVAALGPPVVAVVIFEVLLNATAMFNHANVRMPLALDRVLRWFVVTPDMHRVHHSVTPRECNSNFGFNLPWWDRLLGTYRDQPAAGHEKMQIGISHIRETRQPLHWLLALPFVGATGDYPINRQKFGRSDHSPEPDVGERNDDPTPPDG